MAFEFGAAKVFTTPEQIAMVASAFKKKGKPVAFVSLGAGLHAGHRALIRAAKRIPGAIVIASVHSQDNNSNDIDVDLLKEEKVDAVFAYSPEALWPKGTRTLIAVADHGMENTDELARDASMLLTLLHIVAPTDVVLGEKDYELLVTVQRMVTDLHVPVKVHSVPTVRMPDGVAISLSNAQVAEADREKALALSAALTAGAYAAEGGKEAILETANQVLEAAGVTPDYLELRSLGLTDAPEEGDGRLFAALTLGDVHLIDNVGVPIGIGFKNVGEHEEQ